MMYNTKLAVALKSNGKVLREFGETVFIPFGSEYSVLIKNLNSVRALVTVTIDGADAGDGQQFVVNANDKLELERFLKNGNMNEGNRFKYIERTDSVAEHRGVGIEDGLVRIEFQFEKPQIRQCWNGYRHDLYDNGYCGSMKPYGGSLAKGMRSMDKMGSRTTFTSSEGGADISYSAGVAGADVSCDSMEITQQSVNFSQAEVPVNDAGITVPGSVSDQKFTTVSSFPVEAEKHVIVLKMLGETEDNKQVTTPVTVKAKPECTSCGRTNKATAKFCTECGTSLTII